MFLLAGLAFPAFVLALLAEDVWTHEGFAWDRPIQRWAHALASPGLTHVMVWITRLGYPWGVVPASLLLFVILLFRRRVRPAAFFAVAVLGAVALELMGKLLFHRVRPHLWSSPAPAYGYSFPSGHATLSSAFVASLILLSWPTLMRWPVLLLGSVFALLVGFSRVYLGVHFPSDIVAGWTLSLAWVVGAWYLIGRKTSSGGDEGPARRGAPIWNRH